MEPGRRRQDKGQESRMNFSQQERAAIASAMAILEERARYDAISLSSPGAVTDYVHGASRTQWP
jgi:predicted DNA-binding transcriptional regulator YafY